MTDNRDMEKTKSNNINDMLSKDLSKLTRDEEKVIVEELVKQILKEYRSRDRQGIYGKISRQMAYNSNRIEGNTLTKEQTATLFDTGTLISDGFTVYVNKDIEEMTGHFRMFNYMIETLEKPLSEEQIKKYHYELKTGVFEDIANGYPIGEYKNRVNEVYDIKTVKPNEVSDEIDKLLKEYENNEKDLIELTIFHSKFELIHPFQDGNGRTGRMILFKQCLENGIIPVIIEDEDKAKYIYALNKSQKENDYNMLFDYFKKKQEKVYKTISEFLYKY